MSVIDLHVHIAGIGAGGSGCRVSPALRRNWRYRVYLKAFGVSAAELEAGGDALVVARVSERLARSQHVSRAVILALDGVVDGRGRLLPEQTEVYIPNAFVAEQAARHGNLLFGASVNPGRPDACERLEAVAGQGAVLLKWLPSIQLIDPADARHRPFYRRLAELRLPLLVHTGDERSFTRARHALADPRRLELPLSLGVTVIAAHAAAGGRSAGEDNMQRLLGMHPGHPNLFADISSLTQLNKLGYLRRLLRHPDALGRLVYGSDFPLINTPLVAPWYFPAELGPGKMLALSRNANPWDRDLLLKRALGVPETVFARGAALLRRVESQECDVH